MLAYLGNNLPEGIEREIADPRIKRLESNISEHLHKHVNNLIPKDNSWHQYNFNRYGHDLAVDNNERRIIAERSHIEPFLKRAEVTLPHLINKKAIHTLLNYVRIHPHNPRITGFRNAFLSELQRLEEDHENHGDYLKSLNIEELDDPKKRKALIRELQNAHTSNTPLHKNNIIALLENPINKFHFSETHNNPLRNALGLYTDIHLKNLPPYNSHFLNILRSPNNNPELGVRGEYIHSPEVLNSNVDLRKHLFRHIEHAVPHLQNTYVDRLLKTVIDLPHANNLEPYQPINDYFSQHLRNNGFGVLADSLQDEHDPIHILHPGNFGSAHRMSISSQNQFYNHKKKLLHGLIKG